MNKEEEYKLKIIQMGAMMLIYIFMFSLIYFILAAPLDAIFDGFDDIDSGEAVDEMDTYLPNIKTALNIFFALVIAIPIVGFIMWVYHREPDWGIRRF